MDSVIAEKMSKMERAFVDANELLVKNGMSDPNDLRRWSKSVRHRIQQLCSYLNLLAPVMSPQNVAMEARYELPPAKHHRPNSA